ncbi:hypothetical protein [Metabacillus mangrovi]|nr:hypothetical protein [Metabacillus mangrovi]
MMKISAWLEQTADWFGKKTARGMFHTSLLEGNQKEQGKLSR